MKWTIAMEEESFMSLADTPEIDVCWKCSLDVAYS